MEDGLKIVNLYERADIDLRHDVRGTLPSNFFPIHEVSSSLEEAFRLIYPGRGVLTATFGEG